MIKRKAIATVWAKWQWIAEKADTVVEQTINLIRKVFVFDDPYGNVMKIMMRSLHRTA